MGETLWPLVGGVGTLASSYVVVAWVRLSDFGDTCGLTWLLFFFFSYPNFFPNIDNIYILLGLSRKNKNSREENNRDCSWRRGWKKKQNKERPSEHDETSIKFLEEVINCIPLENEDGADFENVAFIFNLQPGSLLLKQERVIGNITFPWMAATI